MTDKEISKARGCANAIIGLRAIRHEPHPEHAELCARHVLALCSALEAERAAVAELVAATTCVTAHQLWKKGKISANAFLEALAKVGITETEWDGFSNPMDLVAPAVAAALAAFAAGGGQG